MKKYELTAETIEHAGCTLHRIKALRDFGPVKAGELGGWIEKEENLSQDGTAWVFNDAKVYGSAKVYEYAEVHDTAWIYDNAKIYGNAVVCEGARVFDNADIYGCATIYRNASVHGNATVCGEANIGGHINVYGSTIVHGSAKICGNINIYGSANICGDAKVSNRADYIVFKNFWSSGRYFTWTKSNNMWKVGCFYGTGEELIKKAYEDSEKSGKEYKRVVRYVQSILADEKKENE